MPTYEHLAECCGYEWEEKYSMKDDPPTVCPSCETDGKVKRLISGGCAVRVEMNEQELIADAKKGAAEMKRRLATDENYRANYVGESAYHQGQLSVSQINKNLKNI